jgi:hypothetical protein
VSWFDIQFFRWSTLQPKPTTLAHPRRADAVELVDDEMAVELVEDKRSICRRTATSKGLSVTFDCHSIPILPVRVSLGSYGCRYACAGVALWRTPIALADLPTSATGSRAVMAFPPDGGPSEGARWVGSTLVGPKT